jgi:NADH-quinone oxidoreductase subunit M
LVVGMFGVLPLFPMQGWLENFLIKSGISGRLMALGVVIPGGWYIVFRWGTMLVPEGTGWAAHTLAWLGTINLLFVGLSIRKVRTLEGLITLLLSAHGGLLLIGLGALNSVGIQGVSAELAGVPLAMCGLSLASATLRERSGTNALDEFAGLLTPMPRWSMVYGISLLAAMGVPLLSGGWGPWLVLIAIFPSHSAVGWVAFAGAALLFAHGIRHLLSMLQGTVPVGWSSHPKLEPFGGQFPDLRNRELGALVALCSLVVLLGIFPSLWLTLMERRALDVGSWLNVQG